MKYASWVAIALIWSAGVYDIYVNSYRLKYAQEAIKTMAIEQGFCHSLNELIKESRNG